MQGVELAIVPVVDQGQRAILSVRAGYLHVIIGTPHVSAVLLHGTAVFT